MEKSKVYITQDNGKNYAPAHKYGEPIFITNAEYTSVRNSSSNKKIIDNISEMVKSFDANLDYVVLSGDPVIISLTVHAILTEYGYLRVLKWHSIDRMYVPIVLSNNT